MKGLVSSFLIEGLERSELGGVNQPVLFTQSSSEITVVCVMYVVKYSPVIGW